MVLTFSIGQTGMKETNRPPVDITTKVAKQKRRRERRMKDKGPKQAPKKH